MKYVGILVAVLVGFGLMAAGLPAGPVAAQQAVTVTLGTQNNSGVSGTATLTPDGQQTRVVINVTGGGPDPMPAHIHEGTCTNLNPAPKFPLTNVVNGTSETTVNAPLSTIQAAQHAINLHKSAQEVSVYTACGNIQTAQAVTTGAATTGTTTTGTTTTGTATTGTATTARTTTAVVSAATTTGTTATTARTTVASQPSALPSTGESDFTLYGLLAVGILAVAGGTAMLTRRRSP